MVTLLQSQAFRGFIYHMPNLNYLHLQTCILFRIVLSTTHFTMVYDERLIHVPVA